MSNPSETALFFGRLHVLLVHLPIGLIVLVAALEFLSRFRWFKQANASAGLILALAVPASLFAVLCGWLLSWAGGYDERLLQWHKWTGIATAAICIAAAVLYWLDLKRPYRWCVFTSFLTLVVASHFGGSLTHGSDYLVRYAPGPLRAWLGGTGSKPAAPAKGQEFAGIQAFGGVVQPVLEDKCVSCHGPEKAKGGLRLDTMEAILKGGESGPVLVAGKSAESDLLKRIRLPEDHDDHMPPAGKPQLTAEETTLLQWWIDSGASADKKVAELKPPANVSRIVAARFGSPVPAETPVASVAPQPLDQVLGAGAQLAEAMEIAISALSPDEPWLQCNASLVGTNFGDGDLAKLA
ncbi:MAG TPA: c-type cytochrome domain-containing protein, partial [Clostridia bacterium]|nr:c-type cytochrome domain-containing protein [Clostridia bacterium]